MGKCVDQLCAPEKDQRCHSRPGNHGQDRSEAQLDETDEPGRHTAPAEDRLAWVRAAVADNEALAADGMEVERGGRSYTIRDGIR